MLETSARLLRLLSLLQTHRDWSGADLAGRLGVTVRTVRRDVSRLRELGYPVEAVQGAAGYRLGAGASLPPLLLDDDEAVAVAVGLRTAAGGSVAGIEETSLRALGKLERVLPSRLRYRVNALQRATVRVGSSGPEIGADTLMAIADACRRNERLRFGYTGSDGDGSVREAEPYGLVNFGRHWYLVAYDVDRDDWRTFRVDRLSPRTPSGPRFAPREVPDGGVAAFVSRRLAYRAWPFRATVTLHVPAATASERVWPGVGVLEPVDDASCLMHVGADSLWALVWMIASVDLDFTLRDGPPGFPDALRAHAERCLRAVPEDGR
ncbi:helix-turn-helix transcriptional regulator [Actinomadura gamaensis]|uniref:Helix-turn-helix transcriptional regulator n=1 Tax=Actinomadura gamaensis TaxID=1763541 RepID=A0ABV9U2G1_9ACTN